jgi:hypothetical protein
VIVFPGSEWKFHKCVVCGRSVKFDSKASKTVIGAECATKPEHVIERAKHEALETDRRRYRREASDLGFTIE